MTRKKEGRTKNQSLDKAGIIKMVEVAEKPETLRQAEARGEVKVSAEVMQLITGNKLPR